MANFDFINFRNNNNINTNTYTEVRNVRLYKIKIFLKKNKASGLLNNLGLKNKFFVQFEY